MRLLVVEDDPELGRRMSERLRAADFAVELATTCSEVEDWPEVERMAAVILDLGLPDGSGLELLRHWRNQRIETPILILTARGSWQDKVEGLNAGADDFVVKPVRFEELLARLHALLRRRQASRWRSAGRNSVFCTCSCAAPGRSFRNRTFSMISTRSRMRASPTRLRC
jgi:two-component system OmpR family response regulator